MRHIEVLPSHVDCFVTFQRKDKEVRETGIIVWFNVKDRKPGRK